MTRFSANTREAAAPTMDSIISMEGYWNYVAIPYFFVLLGFGTWTLFNFRSVQMTNQTLAGRIAKIIETPLPSTNAKALSPAPSEKQA
jgi:hypothetical protein